MCKWCRTLTPLAAALRGSGSRRRFAATSYAHSTNRSTACRLTSRRESAGRGHPKLESHAHLRARADHPEYAEFGDSVRRAQQAHANTRPMPACGPVVVARLRREPRSHAVDGLARPDATDRSHLHSRKDACTFARHAGLDLRQERRGIRSASPSFRRNRHLSRRSGRQRRNPRAIGRSDATAACS